MATHTLMDFKSQFSKGFARPNLFRVEISTIKAAKQLKYQMGCFQAQIPGHNIATTDKDIGFRSIAYQKIFSDVILGFYVSADLTELKFWQNWVERIIHPTTNWHEYYDKYVGTINITQKNRFGDDVATWTLHDAYPKQVDPIQLDYGTNDAVMTCNTTITYRHFTVEWHTVVDRIKAEDSPSGIEEVTYSHGVQTDLDKISPMLGAYLEKTNWKLRDGSPDESNYAGWDIMTQQQQHIMREYYRLHGPSKQGGALNTLTT
jgi:hypothetical protein